MSENQFEGFNMRLAIVDMLPVIFFTITTIQLGRYLDSSIFIIGAILCFIGGFCKVLWKVVLALKKKDLHFLFLALRLFMPPGFILMIVGFVLRLKAGAIGTLFTALLKFPNLMFAIIGLLGLIAMGYMAKKLNANDSKDNWKEQLVNTFAQAAFMVWILLSI